MPIYVIIYHKNEYFLVQCFIVILNLTNLYFYYKFEFIYIKIFSNNLDD